METYIITKRALFAWNKDMNYFDIHQVQDYLQENVPHICGDVASVVDDGDRIIVDINLV